MKLSIQQGFVKLSVTKPDMISFVSRVISVISHVTTHWAMGSHTNTAFIGVDPGFSERRGCKY